MLTESEVSCEKHCICVPALIAEIERLRDIIEEANGIAYPYAEMAKHVRATDAQARERYDELMRQAEANGAEQT